MTTTLSRRQLIKGLITGASAVAAPWVHTAGKPKVRVLGTHVTLQETIRQQAMQDLNIDLVFEPRGSAAVLQKASMHPEAFDLYEQWSNSLGVLWRSGAIQGIDKRRIHYWDELNDLSKTGKLSADANLGAGDAPYRILHIQPNGELGIEHTDTLSFLPYVHNVDSFGYNTEFIAPGIPYQTESWGWLLEPRYRGQVGIVNAPAIGLFDLALAAQAQGLFEVDDIGNMNRTELNRLFDILFAYKRDGHFSGFWTSVPESVDFMASGRVVIESMFSPAVASLNSRNIPVIYAAPKEGYRGWHGVMCLSSNTTGRIKDAAYDYMNWWLSGWPGAFIARQGYYISNPQRSRQYLSKAEWDYWYQGLPAATALPGTDGAIAVKAGEVRTGGSYVRRFSNVAVWNTVMPTYDYSLQKWYEFISS
ncbi:hypothetical protein GCM10011297_05290 [Bacterioplanes sanyensis]|uniref:ABC transporter substrate-binding protein n=1 Tax=Bacterioplanes sanyensis TaxID=1249553 RepID=UPI0016722818|nr:extracellular solute-binding protein [Bacterioplanes sanyensis]GGY35176.1 hypothetical protein GCM10011297_05290 [Bacterioplanes sanyensis]